MQPQPQDLPDKLVQVGGAKRLTASDTAAWDVFLFALQELPEDRCEDFEKQLFANPEISQQLADAARLLEAIHDCHQIQSQSPVSSPTLVTSAPPATQYRPRPNQKLRPASVFSAALSLAAIVSAASLFQLHARSHHESLHDAVAVTTLLQSSSADTEFLADTDLWLDQHTSSLETPSWLLTAIDLEEQTTPDDDQDEAIF